MRLFIGKKKNDSEFFNGEIEEVRIFTDVRTEAEIRADMFQGETLANSGNLSARYSFDEGSGTAVDNSETTAARDLVASGTGVWAGSGTFDAGTSTVVMAKSGTQTIAYNHLDNDFHNLTINAGSTTQLLSIDGTGSLQDINEDLIVNGILKSHPDSTGRRIRLRDPSATFTVDSSVKDTALADLARIQIDGNGTFNIPELTTKRIFSTSSGTIVSASGPLTVTEEIQVDSGTTFNANGNTITCAFLDVNAGATVDLRNSTYLGTTGGDFNRFDFFHANSTNSLLTGNTTITGTTSPLTQGFFPSGANLEIVGNMSYIHVKDDGDITVVGSVTNCTLEESRGNIRQWHHTLDTQQLLDADEAGDDDLRLEKPTLDNANELQTG